MCFYFLKTNLVSNGIIYYKRLRSALYRHQSINVICFCSCCPRIWSLGKACQRLTFRTSHPLTIRHLWEAENPACKAPCLCSFDETYIVHERILFFSFPFHSDLVMETLSDRSEISLFQRPVKFSAGKHIFKTMSPPHTLMYWRRWNFNDKYTWFSQTSAIRSRCVAWFYLFHLWFRNKL